MGTDLTALNASGFSSGVVSTARVGTNAASGSTFLRGDNSWQIIAIAPAGSDTQVQYNAGGVLAGNPNLTFNFSTGTLTAPNLVGNGANIQQLNASNLITGIIVTNLLGTGTASTSTFLRGDNTWQPLPPTTPVGPVNAVQFNNNGVFGGTSGFLFNSTASTPAGQITGCLDTIPLTTGPSLRFRDVSSNIKGGFTPYGTPFGALAVPCACGRLTLDPNNPAPINNVGLVSKIYYLPCNGNQITLWNANLNDYENIRILDGGWSLDISGLAAGTMYDLYIQNNQDGTGALVYGTIWTNSGTRAANDTIAAGMVFWYNNKRMRYVGTVWIQSAGQTQDTMVLRMIWNAYNQVPRKLMYTGYNPGGGSWNFTNPTTGSNIFRALNNDNTTPRVYFVIGGIPASIGMAGAQFILLDSSAMMNIAANDYVYNGVALDQATISGGFSNDVQSQFGAYAQLSTIQNRYVLPGNIGVGLHWFTLGEGYGNNTGGSSFVTCYTGSTGMVGWLMA